MCVAQESGLEYYQQAEARFANGEYIEALRDLDEAMHLKPEYSWACYKLKARIRSRLEDYIGAVHDYNRAIELNPGDAESYMSRGIEKEKHGDELGALDDYNSAIELKPNYAEAYFHRGFAKGSLGNRQGSCSDWEKAAELGYEEASVKLKAFCR
jgi:tetratricopeptide (TPR) repeat protein